LARVRGRPLHSLLGWFLAGLCVITVLFATRITDIGARQFKAFFGAEVQSTSKMDFTLNGRTPLWGYTTDTIVASPLTKVVFGHGYGTFRIYGKRKFAYGGEAHNAYLQILFELGVVGLAVMIVVLVKLLKSMPVSGPGWRRRMESSIPVLYLLICGIYDSALADSRSFELLFLVAYCSVPLIDYGREDDAYP
jgi:O-antigen ligase